MNKYEGKDNYGKPKMDYVDKVSKMTNEELFEETKSKIWLSTYASNNPRSDYHWNIDVCYDQWVERGNVDNYEKAYNKLFN
ncbi:hypothetical protein ABEY43_07275 [Priestia megaterium]